MAAGARAYELFGNTPKAQIKAIAASKELVENFQNCTGNINCSDITDLDNKSSALRMIFVFVIKGTTFSCFNMFGNFASKAFKIINQNLSTSNTQDLSEPVSCTAILAQKLGATDEQIVMASGLAGGIGLCGEACGALGTAIWLQQMKKKPDNKLSYKDENVLALIEKFLPSADYEFECSAIVGRKFENIEDHARFIKEGGCSKIIETLSKE